MEPLYRSTRQIGVLTYSERRKQSTNLKCAIEILTQSAQSECWVVVHNRSAKPGRPIRVRNQSTKSEYQNRSAKSERHDRNAKSEYQIGVSKSECQIGVPNRRSKSEVWKDHHRLCSGCSSAAGPRMQRLLTKIRRYFTYTDRGSHQRLRNQAARSPPTARLIFPSPYHSSPARTPVVSTPTKPHHHVVLQFLAANATIEVSKVYRFLAKKVF